MAITVTRIIDSEDVWGKTRVATFDITLDTSYPATNGYAITAAQLGLTRILSGHIQGGNKASGALLPMLDYSTADGNPKSSVALRCFYPTGGASTSPAALADPVGAGTIMAGVTPVVADAAQPAVAVALTPGKAKEVKDATDLSTIAYRIQFFGF